MSAFNRLLDQVDGFIRKYYKNQMIKGIFLFIGVLLTTYLLVITLEYFGRFNSYVRGGLLFSFLGLNVYILSRYIAIPLLKLKAYGKRINRYQASSIIGSFFPDVSDRLLNTLQLKDQMDENSADFELLNASVQQRSANLSMVPFTSAIDLNENKRHLMWALPVVCAFLGFAVLAPSFFTEGTERVLKFSQEFTIPSPFKFAFLNEGARIEEGENFPFEVELIGEEIPDRVYVRSEQGRALLRRVTKNKFAGELNQVRANLNLRFEAAVEGEKVLSDEFGLRVISKTALGKMEATLIYPAYLGLENEVIENAADLTIPEGTEITWSVLTKNSADSEFWLGEKRRVFTNDGFKVTSRFSEDVEGKVILKNRQNLKVDTSFFGIEVTKDNFPGIQVGEIQDSLKDGIRYFSGSVNDDHGLSSLTFVYTITSKSGSKRTETMRAGRVVGTQSPFDFAVDFRREEIALEDKIEYHFVVRDNDGVNGSKATRSRSFMYTLPTLEDLNEQRDEEQALAKQDMTDVMKQLEEFQKNLERLKKETLNSSQSNWNKQNQVQQLQEEHKSLIEQLESLQNEMENSMEEKDQLTEMDQELLDQQEMINELLEALMDDELKDLLEQLEELMKEQDEEGVEEALEEAEMSAEDMKRQLDRSLEMLKRLEVNEKVDAIEDELNALSEEQQKLKDDIAKKKDGSDEGDKKKQDDIESKFDELKDDLKELDSLNEELGTPMELGDPEEKADEVSEDMEDAKESMDKGKDQKAGESQEGAAEKMKEMAESLDMMQKQSNEEKQGEDIDMLRNILESLVVLSFDQEDVMRRLSRLTDTDPAFKKYSRRQRKIVDDTKIVRDSLYALAKRQPKIATYIDDELNQIKSNHELSLEDIDERRRVDMGVHQQYAMTSYNNLALMLNESLQEMQQQMQSMMQGSGSCDKPGGKGKGKPGPGKMSGGDMKDMLKKQLEDMKKGANPGGKAPGDKPGTKPGGKDGMGGGMGLGNKQIAKMAAQQAAMRKQLEKMRRELNKDGKGQGNGLSPLIDELEQQEKDLVNKRFGNNMVQRQKEILTRLLESEKALMERGIDEKRESQAGKKENYGNHIQFDQYNKEKLRQIEMLRSVDPAYNKYYKDRANEYFNRML
ncbi:MAG: hypothetical protein ACI865_000366 [Flavobacteriaceae bacterium]|jgi:hypothetical protein